MTMVSDREAEREVLSARVAAVAKPFKTAIRPHPALIRRFEEKIIRLRETLTDHAVRGEAATTVESLVHSVIRRDADGIISADVEASRDTLLRYAQNARSPRRAGGRGCSTMVVAGTGFEPVTFRL